MERLRTGATGAGILLALGVLATTVGLIRGEGARDLRTLTATGAPKRTRRTLTATTAGALALLGSAPRRRRCLHWTSEPASTGPGDLADVPIAHLAALVVGLAAHRGGGRLAAGRQTTSIL